MRNGLSSHLFLRVIVYSFCADSEHSWHHADEEKELCDGTAKVKRCVKRNMYCLGFVLLLAFFILKRQSLCLSELKNLVFFSESHFSSGWLKYLTRTVEIK